MLITNQNQIANSLNRITLLAPGEYDEDVEGDWDDEEDEDFDDEMEFESDKHEISLDDDLGEPDQDEDDHLPDDELN